MTLTVMWSRFDDGHRARWTGVWSLCRGFCRPRRLVVPPPSDLVVSRGMCAVAADEEEK